MRVLVTGGSGFIGTHVVAAATDAGHEVSVLDLVAPDAASRGDVRDEAAVSERLEGVDAVIHLAGKVGLEREVSDGPDYFSHNGFGTATLVSAAARRGVSRIVLGGSMVAYGEGLARCRDHGDVRPLPRRLSDLEAGEFEPRCPKCDALLEPTLVDESAPIDPRNMYAASKVAQEHIVTTWARGSGGSAVLLRFHNVYGPGAPRDNPYSGVASIFLSNVLAGRAPRVTEDGGQRRDFVHVRDVARACVASLEHPLTQGHSRAFNVASGTPRTIGQLAEALADAAGAPPPDITGEFRLGDVRHITASSERATTDLRWSATEDFASGIAEVVAAAETTR